MSFKTFLFHGRITLSKTKITSDFQPQCQNNSMGQRINGADTKTRYSHVKMNVDPYTSYQTQKIDYSFYILQRAYLPS